MGWNDGWRIAEEQLIALHDLGVLTLPVLDAVMKPFGGTDIDEGGLAYRTAKDGKDVFEICIELMADMNDQSVVDSFDDDTHLWDYFDYQAKQRWGWG